MNSLTVPPAPVNPLPADNDPMEGWRSTWRQGIALCLSGEALAALRDGLAADDPALLQGEAVQPHPFQVNGQRPAAGCCAACYGAWKAGEVATVAEVEEYFARVCRDADAHIGHPASVRFFFGGWDDLPRETIRLELLAEVDREISRRAAIKASYRERRDYNDHGGEYHPSYTGRWAR